MGRRLKDEKSNVQGQLLDKTSTAPLNVRQDFTAYIEEVIPSIFRGEFDTLKSIQEVLRRHKYASLVYTDNESIVTMQSMLMFILELIYDLKSSPQLMMAHVCND